MGFRLRCLHKGPAPTTGHFTFDNSIGVNPVDSSGFANLPLRAGGAAKRYYINSSTGSDSNTSTQAQSAATPWATAAKAAAQMVTDDGLGSQFLFAEGTTYAELLPLVAFLDGGFSLQYPLVLQSYDPTDPTNEAKLGRANGTGSHARPKFTHTMTNGYAWMFTGRQAYVAVRGIDLDPGDLADQGLTATTVGDGLLFENCIARNCDLEVNIGAGPQAKHWIFRMCSIYGAYSTVMDNTGSRHGIYAAGCNSMTVEDCVLDHAGQSVTLNSRGDGTVPGNASIYQHPLYIQDTGNTCAVVRRNLIVDGGADGGSFRTDAVIQDNVTLDCPIAVATGGGVDYHWKRPYGNVLDWSFNHIVGTSDINSAAQRKWGVDTSNGKSISIFRYNSLGHGPGSGGSSTFTFHVESVYDQDSFMNLDHNRADGWVASPNPTIRIQDDGYTGRPQYTATNNVWDDAASGSNINIASSPSTNAYTPDQLAVAAGFANKAALMARARSYPEDLRARSLKTLLCAGYNIPTVKPLIDLAWGANWGTGVAESGAISGTIDGSTLSVISGLPSGATLNTDTRSIDFDGTPVSSSSGNLTIQEDPNDGRAVHQTTLAYTITKLPTLSGPTFTPSTTSAVIHVTTDGVDGVISFVLSTTAISPFPAEIAKNSQLSSPRPFAGTASVSGAGTYTYSPTGLTHAVTYHVYAVHKMAGGLYSKAYDLGTFTTT